MQKLSRRTRWIYGSGDIGFSLTSTIIAAYFAIFLTDVVGIVPAVAAGAIFIGRTWDYINDPLVGYISDRTRTRWGRRRPFLLFGALPFGLVFSLMWWIPPIENPISLAVYYGILYAVFDTAFTFVTMPYFALTPELTSDYDERTDLTTTRMFFSILGSLVAFTIPLMIVDGFRPENAGRVLLMGGIFGLAAALPLFGVFLGTREREEFMEISQPSIWRSVKAAWTNRPFMFGLGIYLFTWVAVSIIETILLFYIKYVVEREPQSDLIMATIFVVAIFTLPIWQWASRRYNKRLAYIVGIAFLAVVLLAMASLNPQVPLGILLALCALAGIGVAAAHVLTWAILPDAIEYGEWQTGERHEGMFYSLITLAQKIATSIAIPTALLVLDATGYVANSDSLPQSAVNGIRIVAGPIPAVLMLGGIIFALVYPLGRENYNEIAQGLESRRGAEAD
ncbi:MAG: MFS transporter [Anaerolineales bacterium]|jgi:GPH family glycoside/pentoside/hexuronide:cation symporter